MGPVEQNEMYSSATSHTHIRMTAHALNTPPVGTPPRSATPPPQAEKRKSDRKTTEEGVRSGADAIDPNALNKALMKEFDDGIETSLLVEVRVGSVNGCMAIGEQRFLSAW
jgi:hypothetical protein